MDIADWVDDLSAKQKVHLEQVFEDFDKDKSGGIDNSEMKELLEKSGYNFSELQLKHIVKFADVDGNGVLDKWEFLAICAFVNIVQELFDVHKKEDEAKAYVPFKRLRKILSSASYDFSNKQLRLCRSLCDADKSGRIEFEELLDLFIYLKWLQVAFDKVDVDESNSISLDEVLSALSYLGHKVEPQRAKDVFAKVDMDKSRELDFAEFFEFTVEAKVDVRNLEYEDDGHAIEFDE